MSFIIFFITLLILLIYFIRSYCTFNYIYLKIVENANLSFVWFHNFILQPIYKIIGSKIDLN